MNRVSEAKRILDIAEKRYLNDNKNVDDLRKIWGTNSELFQLHYDDFIKQQKAKI